MRRTDGYGVFFVLDELAFYWPASRIKNTLFSNQVCRYKLL